MFLFLTILVSILPEFGMKQVNGDIICLTLTPKEDTWIFQGEPNTAEGTAYPTELQFGRYIGDAVETWLKFNLTSLSIPTGYVIKSVTLRLCAGSGQAPSNGLIQIWSIANDWAESTLTWNNKPANSYLVNYTNCGFTGSYWVAASAYCRLALNETNVQESYATPSKIYSIALRAPSQPAQTGVLVTLSKEYAPSSPPQLDVTIAPEGMGTNAQLAVLVDRSDPIYYSNYQGGVGKYLEWWKMDYQEIDVSKTQLSTALLSSYRAIIIPQFNATKNGHVSLAELQAINQTVYQNGVGLVQLDAAMTGYTSLWMDYPQIFGITVNGWVTTTDKMNLTIIQNTNFITSIYRNGTKLEAIQRDTPYKYESDLAFLNVTATSGTALAVMPYSGKYYPALLTETVGNGKVVLSTLSTGRVALEVGYDGFGEKPYKTTSGMHGLLWRSIAYVAKKPFVFIGMPPFQTFRVDDVGEFSAATMRSYINEFVKQGIFMNLYPVVDGINSQAGASQVLRDLYWDGSAHVAAYSWTTEQTTDHHIFWNATGAGSEYSTSTLATYFNWLDANFTNWNITASRVIVPHSSFIGVNAIPFLQDRGWTIITGNWLKAPPTSGTMTGWLWDGDFKSPNLSSDYVDANDSIRSVYFNFIATTGDGLRGDIFQEPSMTVNVTEATSYWMSQSEHALADLFPSMPFSHENYMTPFLADGNLEKVLTYAAGNVTELYPLIMPASMEYIAYYTINREGLAISNCDYADNTLTLNMSGTSNMATALYVFSDQKLISCSGILDEFQSYDTNGYLVWVPAYSGNKQIVLTFGASETANPHIYYAPFNVTSTAYTAGRLAINASQVNVHRQPKYPMKINSTNLGRPESVTVGGAQVEFSYDDTTKLVSFMVTFDSGLVGSEIVVSWSSVDTQPPSYSYVGHSTTLAGSECQFCSLWRDNGGLSGYVFGTNVSGIWVNDTWMSLSGDHAWANVTKDLIDEGDAVVGYRWFCNDTSNNWASTETFTLRTIWRDVQSPSFGDIQVNTTVAGNPGEFSSYWQDQGGLSGCIFSTNNTGSWANDTFASLNGLVGWANVTKTLNDTVGNVVGYRWYCLDLSGNWNDTGLQAFTTAYSVPPQYSTISYSTTEQNRPCAFGALWVDDQALSGYVFGSNLTGTWVNDTFSRLSGSKSWANKTVTLPSSAGVTVEFEWWCNDSQNQWSSTSPQYLLTTPGQAPAFSSIGYNSSLVGSTNQFGCFWQDEDGLSGFIFSWNGTGAWENDTWSGLGGTSGWANVTKTLNDIVGTVTGFRWYCSDIYGNWNSTGLQTLTTTGQPVFEFSVPTSPLSRNVAAGSAATFTVTSKLLNGTAQSVSFSCSGLPSGAAANFSPASGLPTFSSTLKITTSASTPPGVYIITVTGSGPYDSHSTTLQLKIMNLTVAPTPFSPNGDGVKDASTVDSAFWSSLTWTLTVKNAAGTVVRHLGNGSGSSLSMIWDGRDDSGTIVLDGTYKVNLSLPGFTKTVSVVVDTKLPTVTCSWSRNSFNPRSGQTSKLTYALSEKCTISIQIYDSAGNLVKTLLASITKNAGTYSTTWNGKNSSGVIVPAGIYTCKIYATDVAGNQVSPYPTTCSIEVS
jgi:flagellar hook assembly protein FlgD